MENAVSKIRLVKSFFTGEYCLKNNKRKKLTRWFKTYDETIVGNFVKLETDIGTFVYHKNQPELLYEYYGEDEFVYVHKLTDDIYYLHIGCAEWCSFVQLYRANGTSINMSALEDVCYIGNDLIAAKEFCGKWGILDNNLNWKIYPIYDEVFEFINGFARAFISEENTTDLISVEENGYINIINVEGCAVDYLSSHLIYASKNNKYGVYNTKGEKVLDIEYDKIRLLGNHLIIEKKGLYGLADITGKILYECKYFQIYKTENGFKLITRKIVDTEECITV